jgi:AraC-like DNA-binding protein
MTNRQECVDRQHYKHARMSSHPYERQAAARVLTLLPAERLPLICGMGQQTIVIEQLVPGRLEATHSTAAFGAVLISRISTNLPALIQVPGLPGWTSYVMSKLEGCIYCTGIRCGPEHCLIVGSSANVELICREPAELTVCRIGARHSVWSAFQCGTYRLAGNAAELAAVRAIISSLHDRATPVHDVTYADLRDSLTALSAVPEPTEYLPRSHRAMAVERGRRYIHANLVAALRIASVCEAAGIRSRTLEYGFRDLFGISPVTYIKAMRLNHVHRLLLSRACARRTITAIALDSGFWHLSQFAADYQRFFGENPSITRRQSLARKSEAIQEARSASGF